MGAVLSPVLHSYVVAPETNKVNGDPRHTAGSAAGAMEQMLRWGSKAARSETGMYG